MNAPTQNALTQNALTQNALTQNALTQNAPTQNAQTVTPRAVIMRTLAAGLQHVVAYAKGILGEDAYDKYLAYHRSVHSDAVPMTVKEFWRDKTDREGSNPQGRCC